MSQKRIYISNEKKEFKYDFDNGKVNQKVKSRLNTGQTSSGKTRGSISSSRYTGSKDNKIVCKLKDRKEEYNKELNSEMRDMNSLNKFTHVKTDKVNKNIPRINLSNFNTNGNNNIKEKKDIKMQIELKSDRAEKIKLNVNVNENVKKNEDVKDLNE